MFNNQYKKNIVKAFQNIDHLKRESKINIAYLYLFFLIPVFLIPLNFFLILLFDKVIPDRLYFFILIIFACINIYRISWTYQNPFKCFFTFSFFLLCFFILVACFMISPFSNIPANAFLNSVIYQYRDGFRMGGITDQYIQSLVNEYTNQQYLLNFVKIILSTLYAHMVYVFLSHFQIRITQTMLYFYNLGIEPKLIAEYIVDPDNNLKLEEEARYRYENLNKSKITQSISNFQSESVQKINNNFSSTNAAYTRNEISKIVKLITSKQLKLDSSKVTIDSDFKNDLRADDIEIAEIIIDMENYFEIKISNEDADSFNTIGDVVIFIEKNI